MQQKTPIAPIPDGAVPRLLPLHSRGSGCTTQARLRLPPRKTPMVRSPTYRLGFKNGVQTGTKAHESLRDNGQDESPEAVRKTGRSERSWRGDKEPCKMKMSHTSELRVEVRLHPRHLLWQTSIPCNGHRRFHEGNTRLFYLIRPYERIRTRSYCHGYGTNEHCSGNTP